MPIAWCLLAFAYKLLLMPPEIVILQTYVYSILSSFSLFHVNDWKTILHHVLYVLLKTVFDRIDLIALFTSFYELKIKNKLFEYGPNEIRQCPVSRALFFPGITLLYAGTYYLPKYFKKIMRCILFLLF